MRNFSSVAELIASVGEPLGESAWHQVTQEDIDAFARLTGDRQWIHVDPTRAKAGPFGSTVAHGYLTLSMLPVLMHEILNVENVRMTINYGLDRVRFLEPLEAGASIRARATLRRVDMTPKGVITLMEVTIEKEGGGRPVCIAETLTLRIPTTGSHR